MDLISKSEYPDYYRIIQKPMSFNLVYVRLFLAIDHNPLLGLIWRFIRGSTAKA